MEIPVEAYSEKSELKKHRRFRKSRGGRFLKIASLASRVSTSYLGQKLKKVFVSEEESLLSLAAAHLRNAHRVVKTFGELKGAVMKVGQMMSLYSDILPSEYVQVLSMLQQQAPPVRFRVVAGQIESELGRSLDEVFDSIDSRPFASASIGQVHRGVLKDGREVAVKVQYPGVARTVESDMKNLRMVLHSIGLLKKERGVEELIAEVRARLVEELDYLNELENMKTFRTLFEDDERVVIPEAYEDVTTRRVLFMEYLVGRNFAGICDQGDRDLLDAAGQTFVDIFCRQLFEFRALHADPNPANFSFLPDGRIVLYDFGCVRFFPAEFVTAYAQLVRETLDGRYDRLPENLERIGLVPIGDRSYDGEFYGKFAVPLLEPFRGDGPYDFGEARIHDDIIELGLKHWQDTLHFRAPPEIVFIDRVIAGMYSNLRKLRARGNWRAILEAHL